LKASQSARIRIVILKNFMSAHNTKKIVRHADVQFFSITIVPLCLKVISSNLL